MLLRPGKHIVSKYWDFDPGKRIRYRTDAEYEEHFRSVLATAVQRRLRSDRPVLAELSGGMDSSSIVCMADIVIARGVAECPRLDTISWFNDSYDHLERDSNELHWISKVEQKRGRTGFHINTALQQGAARKQAHENGLSPSLTMIALRRLPYPTRVFLNSSSSMRRTWGYLDIALLSPASVETSPRAAACPHQHQNSKISWHEPDSLPSLANLVPGLRR